MTSYKLSADTRHRYLPSLFGSANGGRGPQTDGNLSLRSGRLEKPSQLISPGVSDAQVRDDIIVTRLQPLRFSFSGREWNSTLTHVYIIVSTLDTNAVPHQHTKKHFLRAFKSSTSRDLSAAPSFICWSSFLTSCLIVSEACERGVSKIKTMLRRLLSSAGTLSGPGRAGAGDEKKFFFGAQRPSEVSHVEPPRLDDEEEQSQNRSPSL